MKCHGICSLKGVKIMNGVIDNMMFSFSGVGGR